MSGIHMGQLLERAIRRMGFNITEVAITLGVSRRTLYNWFKLEAIDPVIIERISSVIKLELILDQSEVTVTNTKNEALLPLKDENYWRNKYIDLLERYSELIKSNQEIVR